MFAKNRDRNHRRCESDQVIVLTVLLEPTVKRNMSVKASMVVATMMLNLSLLVNTGSCVPIMTSTVR